MCEVVRVGGYRGCCMCEVVRVCLYVKVTVCARWFGCVCVCV